jgi:hypothetical protein
MNVGAKLLRFFAKKRVNFLLLSLFLVYIGSRAVVINYSGTYTPFLDEWDAEASSLLAPYIQGKLTVGDLFRPFAEHIIFFTRLTTLAVFNISGYWDVELQMIVNAIIDAATVVGISYAFSRVLRGWWAPTAMILSTLVNAVPLTGDSILMGFLTQFYLLLTFSFASLWLLADSRAWSLRWTAGILCAVASYLCMASGALTFAAAMGLHITQMACGRRAGLKEWLGIAALAAATVAAVSQIPHVPETDPYRPHSLRQFLWAFLQLASWPAPAVLGCVVVLPSALFCLRTFVDCPALIDPRWFNVAGFGWVLAQFVALAAGRGGAPIANRYFDTMLIGLAINLTSVFWLLGSHPLPLRSRAIGGQSKVWASLALVAWLAVVTASLMHQARHLPGYLSYRRQTAEVQTKNLRGYLASGDTSYLAGVPGVAIPYPVSSRLRELLDMPEIRAVLPPELLSRDAPPNWVEAFKRNFLGHGFTWLGSGIFLLIAVIARGRRRLAESDVHRPELGGGSEMRRPSPSGLGVGPTDFRAERR